MRHNSNSMGLGTPWDFFSIPDTTYPQKKHCLLPEPDTADSLIPKTPRNRRERRPPSSDDAHKTLFPPYDEDEHDAPIEHRLIGAYRYDTCMHLCPYAPGRYRHGVGRGQPLTDPSPDTITHIVFFFSLNAQSQGPDVPCSLHPHGVPREFGLTSSVFNQVLSRFYSKCHRHPSFHYVLRS